MKFNKSHLITLVIGAALGIGGVLVVKNEPAIDEDLLELREASHADARAPHVFNAKPQKKSRLIKQQGHVSPGSSQSMNQVTNQIRKEMDKMMRSAFSTSGLFDDVDDADHDMGMSNGIKINEDEDAQYKYVKISGEGVDQDSLDIQIKNGMISISGRVEKKEGDGKSFESTSISSFSQSFNIPNGVSDNDVKMVSKKDALVLKFKKI